MKIEVDDAIESVMSAVEAREPEDIRQAVYFGMEEYAKLLPDVEPFTYSGWPGAEKRHVFLHPPCGTVTDADPALTGEGSMWDAVQASECGCETPAPWLRIYVEKREA